MIDYRIKLELLHNARKIFLAYQHSGKICVTLVSSHVLDRHWRKVVNFDWTGCDMSILVCFNDTIAYAENIYTAKRAARIADLNELQFYSLIPRYR